MKSECLERFKWSQNRVYSRSKHAILLFVFMAATQLTGTLYAQDTSTRHQINLSTTLEAGVIEVEGYERSSAITASPAFLFLGSRAIVRSRAAISRYASGRISGYGDLYAGYQLPDLSRITMAVEAEGGVGTYRGKMSGHFLRSGIVMGTGEHIITQFHVTRAFDTSAYNVVSGALTVPFEKKYVEISPTFRLMHAQGRNLGQLMLETFYETDRFRLMTQVGMATDASRQQLFSMRPSGAIGATFTILRSVALTLNAGELPPDYERGVSASRQLSLGVSVGRRYRQASGSAERFKGFVVQQSKSDSVTYLVVRLDDAVNVEVRGSFTGWRPMAMRKDDNGNWSFPVFLSTGVYSVAIRVDGGPWHGPSGLAKAQDEFGEHYGLLVVK